MLDLLLRVYSLSINPNCRAGKLAQRGKALAAKPDHLSMFVPQGLHGGKRTKSQKLSSNLRMCTVEYMHKHKGGDAHARTHGPMHKCTQLTKQDK